MRKLFAFSILFILMSKISPAQVGPSFIGQWKALVPYYYGISVTETKKNIIYVSNHGLISINKDDLSLSFTSKIEGLSNANPRLIAYNENTSNIMVSYEDGDLDLIVDGRIINAPFIRNSTNIIGSKKIHNLISIDQFIYILTDFGVVKFDIEALEVVTTLKTDFPVYSFAEAQNQFFMGTENGLFYTDKNTSNLEFSFINTWSRLKNANGDVIDLPIPSVCNYQDQLLFGTYSGEVIQWTTLNTLDTLHAHANRRVPFIGTDNNNGYFYVLRCPEGLNCDRGVFHINSDGSSTQLDYRCVGRPTNVLQDDRGRIWLGDEFGELRWLESENSSCNRINTNTPRDKSVFDVVQTNNGELWLANGSYELKNVSIFQFNDITYMFYSDGQWKSKSWKSDQILVDNELAVICNMAYDPLRDKIYLASYLDGLLEIDGNSAVVYNETDDHLGFDSGDASRTKVFDVEVAQNGDVWMSNYRTSFPIRVKRVDGSWEKFRANGRTELTDLVIDDFGNKWYVDISSNNGLVVFNENDPSTSSDDQTKTFNTSNSNLTTNNVTFIEKDLDGAIWVGTALGVFVFDCGINVFEDICRGFRPIITVDGLPEALLNDEYVTAIAVDGGNRKWFGTSNGIFVHSPDGQVQEFRYNEDNSPLFSNNISTININKKSGEVFIGTSSGLNVLQTDVRQGEDYHQSKIRVYPNPVYPDYKGPIAFDGLAQDADFRITDISGRLVYKDKSVGGQAVWYGDDLTGKQVKSGVYLIWGATEDINQSEGIVGKVLVIGD